MGVQWTVMPGCSAEYSRLLLLVLFGAFKQASGSVLEENTSVYINYSSTCNRALGNGSETPP